VNISNARLGYEPHRGDGALCVCFKDKREAVGFAEAILQEVQNIENSNLSVSECSLITINFGEEGKQERSQAFREVFPGQNQDVLISVPDLANLLTDGEKEI
jgi:hypothetical protein